MVLAPYGCSGGSDQGGGTTSGETRTIEHKYGTTEISGTPKRVVTVGLTEQDYVLAFGLAPVGAREWFGGYPGALWPWASEELGDRPLPEVLPVNELNFEQIAALDADLILGVNSGLLQQEYDSLSEIAPTVAQATGYADFGAPWQEITRIVGRALGRSEQTQDLVSPIEDRFEQTRSEHPEFEGSTGLLATIVDDGSFYVYAEGPAPRFLKTLGLELPPDATDQFSGENRAPVQISLERLGILESDVLALGLYGEDKSGLDEIQLYQGLDTVEEGRDILMPEMSLANGALSFGSVLSLPIALDEMVPRISTAIDGDPGTEVENIPTVDALEQGAQATSS
jgi:iron complex transport system substrate-binding protein